MPKDRLSALIAGSVYRNNRNASGNGEPMPNNQDTSDIDDGVLIRSKRQCLLGDFLADVEKVREDIDWLRDMVEKVKANYTIMLSAHNPLVDEALRRKGDDLTNSIRGKSIKVKGKLKDFEVEMERSKKENPTSAEVRIRQMQYEALSRMFVDVMIECNSAQAHYREKCKEKLKRQLEIHGKPTNDEHVQEILEQGSCPTFSVFEIKSELLEAQTVLTDVEARHKDILKLEKSITELHSMFMEMSVTVQRQGDMIDRIAYNVLKTVDFVDKAKQETRKGLVYKH